MSPEELDVAIERLLEENPNQEKVVRRRKNKLKDLQRRVRSGKTIISEKIVRDLVGDQIYHTIDTVEITYEEVKIYKGMFEGWYDDINEVSEALGVYKKDISLEKNYTYDWDKELHLWDGTSRVYLNGYKLVMRYRTEEGKIVRTRGIFRTEFLEKGKPIEEGVYVYTDEMKELIDKEFGKAPNKRVVDKYKLSTLRYNSDKLFNYDVKGKYGLHRRAIKEQNKWHFYSGTIRIEKGDLLGTTNKYINAVNANFRNKRDFMEDTEKLEQDLVEAYYDVVNEYIW